MNDSLNLIEKLAGHENEEQMILVTGGSQEVKAIRAAKNDLEQRGYKLGNVYVRYMMKKYKLEEEEIADWIIKDLESGERREQAKRCEQQAAGCKGPAVILWNRGRLLFCNQVIKKCVLF